MRSFIFVSSALACLALATPSVAEELVGKELIAAVNGKTLTCKSGGRNVVIKFGKFKDNKIPFQATVGGRNIKAGYKLTKAGKFRQINSNASRKIVRDDKGNVTITGNGIKKTVCPK